jgi:hypothetical protein
LTAINAVNPYTLMALVLAFAAGKGIVGLVAALRMLQAIRALRALSFLPAVASLTAATAALNGAAAAIAGMASAISQLARMVASIGLRTRVNTSAIDRLKAIWDSTPKNATATVQMGSVNLAVVAMMGINSTMAAIMTNLSVPAQLTARADVGLALGVFALLLVAWVAVRAVGLATVVFTALAINLASVGMNAMTAAWLRVRAAAAGTVTFGVTATPGNVSAVASQIVAAWARVRVASTSRPRFTAIAFNTVSAGAAMIVAAWMRVRAMPKLFRAIGIVNPGNVPGASARIISSWRRLYGLARRWHGVAICSFGGFGGVSLGPGGGGIGPMSPSMGGGNVDLKGGYGPLPGWASNLLQKIPGFDDFGSVDMGDYLGGGDPFYPDDFDGGFGSDGTFNEDFGGGFAQGGPIGGYGRISAIKTGGGHRGRTVHINEDVWIRSEQDLIDILMNAM